jgi:hypothetical protein
MEGHRPLVERNGRTDLEIVIEEIMTDKIGLDFENASLVEAKTVSNGSDALL